MEITAPESWRMTKLSSVFSKRNEKVGDSEITPYSCTNIGIIPREEKFDKALAASLQKNKVAYKGDFVFGMSREILNFGMMTDDIGCFSSAYKIYAVENFKFATFLERFIRINHDYYYQAVTGGAREGKGLSERDLFDLWAPVPPEIELDAIFSVLSLFDSKITLLEESIALSKAISQGVISDILSGEIDLQSSTDLLLD